MCDEDLVATDAWDEECVADHTGVPLILIFLLVSTGMDNHSIYPLELPSVPSRLACDLGRLASRAKLAKSRLRDVCREVI